jgi:hypothetical protein
MSSHSIRVAPVSMTLFFLFSVKERCWLTSLASNLLIWPVGIRSRQSWWPHDDFIYFLGGRGLWETKNNEVFCSLLRARLWFKTSYMNLRTLMLRRSPPPCTKPQSLNLNSDAFIETKSIWNVVQAAKPVTLYTHLASPHGPRQRL